MTATQVSRLDAHLPSYAYPIVDIDNRRGGHRVRTVYRVVRIETEHDQGLARVRNISDGGMKISHNMPMMLGDKVRVALTDDTELEGQVIWTNGNDCGLKFAEEIDSISILRATAEHCRSGDARAPRLKATGMVAVAASQNGLRPVTVHDVSLRGMKIAHSGGFTPGLPVKICFSSGVERRGVIRWSTDTLAGLMLTEPFVVTELGALSAL